MSILEDVILPPDTRANQPAANTVSVGALYCVTDEADIVERSNGTSWDPYSPSASGSGSVTNTGTLTDHALIVGNGGVDVSALASLGTTTTVLHGNAAGDPTFGAVDLATDVTGVVPGANGGGLVLLGTYTASGAAAFLVVTRNATGASGAIFQSDFDTYEFEFTSVYPSTSGQALRGRVSSDGGATYISTGSYSYDNLRYATTGPFLSQASGQTEMFLSINTLSNHTSWGYSGILTLFQPLSTAVMKQWRAHFSGLESTASARIIEDVSGAFEVAATAVNAVTFYVTNNINGTIRVFGRAKS